MSNHLADEARKRGIRPIELKPGDDLEQLVRDAVAGGADGLAAAGGDGTQALVASIAAEHDLPFACIPAGTRNHFALDLGVDRDDVVGALDAFVNGGERRIDLADLNGRVFVNNVSLGLYAEAVQREGYRDAKLRTILDTAPDVLGCRQATPRQARLARRERHGARIGGCDPGLQQHVPARATRRFGHTPAHRRGRLGVAVLNTASGAGRALATMVDTHVRGHIIASGTRRSRRRGTRHGSPASLSQPAECAAGTPRAATPRCLTVGRAPRRDRRPPQEARCCGCRTGSEARGALAVPVEQAPNRRALPWPLHAEEFVPNPRRAVGCASVLLALVMLGAFLISAGPLALDSRWSELMQDVEIPSSRISH